MQTAIIAGCAAVVAGVLAATITGIVAWRNAGRNHRWEVQSTKERIREEREAEQARYEREREAEAERYRREREAEQERHQRLVEQDRVRWERERKLRYDERRIETYFDFVTTVMEYAS